MDRNDLKELFFPGKGKVPRVPNRLAKGFLKKSILYRRGSLHTKWKQGEKEMARRRSQIQRRIISLDQIIHV